MRVIIVLSPSLGCRSESHRLPRGTDAAYGAVGSVVVVMVVAVSSLAGAGRGVLGVMPVCHRTWWSWRPPFLVVVVVRSTVVCCLVDVRDNQNT